MNPVIPLVGAIIAIVLAMYINDLRKMYKHYTSKDSEVNSQSNHTKDV